MRYKPEAIEKKVISLTTLVVGVPKKRETFVRLLTEALGTPCPYCGDRLVLSKVSLDHKTPLPRNQKLSYEERVELNRLANLHFVCRKCNRQKGDMTDEQFRRLRSFLSENSDIREHVLPRLGQSVTFWARRKVKP